MPAEAVKKGNPKFPLRLMPSVRRTAEAFSEREGVSLNQFINLAVAEKLAHLEHDEWVMSRKEPTKEVIDDALALLAKARGKPVDPLDSIPSGYPHAQGASAKKRRA